MRVLVRGFYVALGVLSSCGGREASGDRRDGMTSPDAGEDTIPYLEGLRLPPGARISRSHFQPPRSECEAASECAVAGSVGTCTAISGRYRVCVPEVRVATAPT